MKLFLCILSITLACGDKLENVYLPPSSSQSAGGNGNFLSAPHFGGQSPLRSSGSSFSAGPANSYIPPASGPVSDAGYGPSSGQYNSEAFRSSQASGPQFRILKSDSQNPGDGSYKFEYETENHISQHESGEINHGAGEDGSSVVRGSYSYTAPNGQQITVNYIADENGFRAEGDHIPTPPSIPAEIQKSLTINARESGGYSSGSSGAYEGVEVNSANNAPTRQYLAPSLSAARQQNFPAVNGQYQAPSFGAAGSQNTPAVNRQYQASSFGASGQQQNSFAANRQYIAPAVDSRIQQNRQYLAPGVARAGQENGGYRY